MSCERHATPKNIVKMAASRAGTLLGYFKRGSEDEERKDEENASNTGDYQPTRVKRQRRTETPNQLGKGFCVVYSLQ